MTPELPRYDRTCRRDFLRRAALVGGAALVPGLACGTDDAAVLGREGTTTTSASNTATTLASSTTAAPSSSTPAEPTSSQPPATGTALPDGAALEVTFTYAASGGGQVRNPYIAAWIESTTGDLVRNLALWYNPPKGDRWVSHLSSWYAADGAYYREHGSDDLASVTGASRPAGTYALHWDGVDEAGARVERGDYVILVEAAREHGPHSLMSASITMGTSGTIVELDADGELTGGTAEYAA